MSRADLCKALKCRDDDIGSYVLETTPDRYLRLFEQAAIDLGDPSLGLNIAKSANPNHFGLLGYIADNATSIRDFCVFVDHYFDIFTPHFGIEFNRSGGLCKVTYSEELLPGSDCRQDIDFTLGFLVETMRKKIGDMRWTPKFCYFTYSKPKHLSVHHDVFGTELKFNAPVNQIIFDQKILQVPISGVDSDLLTVLRQQADLLINQPYAFQNIVRKVKLILTSQLSQSNLTAESVADKLNTSVRKLHRDLSREDTSFRELRNQVIEAAAKEALDFSDASVSEIAESLGYSETSAFVRAFKRTEGISPLQYRKRAS
ncbi:AraC family transcriptional regulator [Ruegeria sp. 2012CJ41-6]|uniref:AraC family transcriptional regulator n=1 Tax=Ruegeria spongiae TaxID=2942209 RepID=A0ABT0Q0I9_9RHOB|nr:AraC family transcriptional regulator [Ruegeria spongiae]MCL6282454.1 AraC family transcriptional regulator [Ruegeria spongiae]